MQVVRVSFLAFRAYDVEADPEGSADDDDLNQSAAPATFPQSGSREFDAVKDELKVLVENKKLFQLELTIDRVKDFCYTSDISDWGRDAAWRMERILNQSDLSVLLLPSDEPECNEDWRDLIQSVEGFWRNAQRPPAHRIIRICLEGFSGDCYSFPVKSCVPKLFLKKGLKSNSVEVARWIFNQILMLKIGPHNCLDYFFSSIIIELQEYYRKLEIKERLDCGRDEPDFWSDWTRMSYSFCNFGWEYLKYKTEHSVSDPYYDIPIKVDLNYCFTREKADHGMTVLCDLIISLYHNRNVTLPLLFNPDYYQFCDECSSIAGKISKLAAAANDFNPDETTRHLLRHRKYREAIKPKTVEKTLL